MASDPAADDHQVVVGLLRLTDSPGPMSGSGEGSWMRSLSWKSVSRGYYSTGKSSC